MALGPEPGPIPALNSVTVGGAAAAVAERDHAKVAMTRAAHARSAERAPSDGLGSPATTLPILPYPYRRAHRRSTAHAYTRRRASRGASGLVVVVVVVGVGVGLAAAGADARASASQPVSRLSPPGSSGQLVLLSYVESRDLERLAQAVETAGVPAGVPVYVGSYGVNPRVGERVRALPGGRYAPMFTIQPSSYWTRRRLDPGGGRPPVGEDLDGVIPPLEGQTELSRRRRVAWGRELGRRFRDRLRQIRATGATIDTWQFDEVPHTAIGAAGTPVREFTRGVLEGLGEGRPELGDRPERGFVYVAPEALALASEPVDDELARFWRALDAACLRFVGEEYPEFVGDPVAVGLAHAAGQRALERGDAVRRSLAARYVPGVTPGYRLGVSLGGNVAGLRRDEVNAWRDAFVSERARHGVAGFAAYHFRFENATTEVMEDVVRALARGVDAAGGRGAVTGEAEARPSRPLVAAPCPSGAHPNWCGRAGMW